MKRKALKATAAVAALLLGTALVAAPTLAHGPGGPGGQGDRGGYGMHSGQFGPGMMGGYGPGMQGSQMGPGMMGYGPGAQGDCPFNKASLDEDLTVESVTKFLEQRLSHMGNERLKVGEVTAKDDDTIVAEIVTVDGSLVQKLEFDRDTGRHNPVR